MVLENYIANPWLRGVALIFIVFFALKILIFIVEKTIIALTRKTKTNLDDQLIGRSSKPITIIAFIIGVRISLGEFPINETTLNLSSKIFSSLITIFFAYLIYVLVDVLVFTAWKKFAARTKSTTDDAIINLMNSILQIIWVIFAFLYVLTIWGVQIGPFLAGLGIGGLAVALALQPTLSNIFSGMSIIFDKTVQVGDLIYLDANTKGKVMRIGLRATRIKTFDNEVIIVPNNKLADSQIQNVNQPEPKSRVVIPFGVAYGSDIDKVKKLIEKEIKQVKDVIIDDEKLTSMVRFIEMGTSSLNFKAYFYVDTFEHRFKAIDEANTKIYNALNKAGINIPFPQVDVHFPDTPKSTKKGK